MWHWILRWALCPTLPYRPAPCLSEVSRSHQARCLHAAAPARPSPPVPPPPPASWPALPLPPPPPSWWPWPAGFRYGSSPFRASPFYPTVQPSSVRDMNSGNIYSKITVHIPIPRYVSPPMLCFVCRVDNIYLSRTLKYQIRLLLTQMWCHQPHTP